MRPHANGLEFAVNSSSCDGERKGTQRGGWLTTANVYCIYMQDLVGPASFVSCIFPLPSISARGGLSAGSSTWES